MTKIFLSHKNYLFISLLILLFIPCETFAQISKEITFGGVIRDENHKPIAFADVFLTDSNGILLENCSTGLDGKFTMVKNIMYGVNIKLSISYIGYKKHNLILELFPNKRFYNIGIINLEPSNELNNITVTAKAIIMPSADGYIYNVASDSLAKNKRIVSLIEKLPFMELDEKNIPRYFGGNAKIVYLVNGKRSNVISASSDIILKMTKGENIVSIELVPNPPPGFNSSDVVINIITKKKNLFEGVLIQTSVSQSFSQQNFSNRPIVSLVLGWKKLSFNTSFSYSNSISLKDMTSLTQRYQLAENNLFTDLILQSKTKSNSYANIISTGIRADYKINNKQNISISYGYNSENKRGYKTGDYIYKNDALNSTYHTSTKNNNNSHAGSISYYNGGFLGKDFSIKYNFNSSDNNIDIKNHRLYIDSTSQNLNITAGNNFYNSIGSVFSLPITKNKKHYIALDASYSNNYNSNATEYARYDIISERWIMNNSANNFSNYRVQEAKFKTSYSFKFKRSRLDLNLNGNYYGNSGNLSNTLITYNSFSILPSISLSILPNYFTTLRIGYNREAQNPQLSTLNPVIDNSNPLYITVGNPNLKDSKSDNFALLYMFQRKKQTFSLAGNYSYSSDIIQNYDYINEDGVNVSTYRNLGINHKISAKGTYQYNFNRKISVKGTIQYSYYYYNGIKSLDLKSTEKDEMSYSLNGRYKINNLISIKLSGMFIPSLMSSGSNYQNNKTYYSFLNSLSISGNSKNMRLNYSLSINNINKFNYREKSSLIIDNFLSYSEYSILGASIGFSVSYTFGRNKN